MTNKENQRQLGLLPPKYGFALNPYPDERISSCPECGGKTGQRKLPLFIHVAPRNPILLNYTCRFCKRCDLLIAHKHEIEHHLTDLFQQRKPEVIGNYYMVVGTVEKAVWREGLTNPKPPAEILSHLSDFRRNVGEIRMTMKGWYPGNIEPPVLEPPPSQEWVGDARE